MSEIEFFIFFICFPIFIKIFLAVGDTPSIIFDDNEHVILSDDNRSSVILEIELENNSIKSYHFTPIHITKGNIDIQGEEISQYEDNSVLLAHCTVPLNMCSSYSLDTHFESGLGIGVKGDMPEGRITICKIAPDYSLDNTVCLPASIKESVSIPGYCRTQIVVSLNEEGLIDILKASFGNHLIISYGDVYQDLLPLLSLLRRNEEK